MTTFPLTQGLTAFVDDEDVPLVAAHKWTAHRSQSGWYARSKAGRMHRVILAVGPKVHVDHRNGDTLDNRRSNLRIASPSQNAANRGPRANNALGIKGVQRRGPTTFAARITVDGKTRGLGTYRSAEAAGRAYDAAALAVFGDFARLNYAPVEGSNARPVSPLRAGVGSEPSTGSSRGEPVGSGDRRE